MILVIFRLIENVSPTDGVETLPEPAAPGVTGNAAQEAARRDAAETKASSNTSVVKNMSNLVKIKDEEKITPYVKDSESGEEVDVVKEQLDVLVKIQNDLKRQQVVQ